MVACTFLSAPLMFISAKMIAASTMDPDHYKQLYEAYEFHISILSLIGGVSIYTIDGNGIACTAK